MIHQIDGHHQVFIVLPILNVVQFYARDVSAMHNYLHMETVVH